MSVTPIDTIFQAALLRVAYRQGNVNVSMPTAAVDDWDQFVRRTFDPQGNRSFGSDIVLQRYNFINSYEQNRPGNPGGHVVGVKQR
jgi:hypothetical protein